MIPEHDRRKLLTLCNLKVTDELPAGVRAVYEDFSTKRTLMPGIDPSLVLVAILGQAADMERPKIATESPQVATVRPTGQLTERQKAFQERRRQERAAAKAAKQESAQTNG